MSYFERSKKSVRELKDDLGWCDKDTESTVVLLLETVMCLCDKIEALEKKLETQPLF